MTLSDRIRLIEDMIRENPEASIVDYIEALEEIMQVEEKTEEVFMAKRLKENRARAFLRRNIVRDERGRFICNNHKVAS